MISADLICDCDLPFDEIRSLSFAGYKKNQKRYKIPENLQYVIYVGNIVI